MAKRWGISPVEIERRRHERGLRLSQGVTEHRLPNGTYYTVRSETTPSKLYKIEWDRHKSKWVCGCLDSKHHQATQYNSYRCAHQWAIELALTRGLIHGVDSLIAARQRYRNGGAMGRK